MSSLLSNDFVEEYFRVENNITTNNQTFYVDRESQLIYTTPFFTLRDIISDAKIILGSKNTPQNVNIIVDSIALLSTNPNIQNYLPLKINLGGNKPAIEFSNVTQSTLVDYKIIVDPSINLNTVTNLRYSNPINYCYDYVGDGVIQEIFDVIRTGTATTGKYYVLSNLSSNINVITRYQTDITPLNVSLNNSDSIEFIYGNDQQAVAVNLPPLLNTIELFDLNAYTAVPLLPFFTVSDETFISLFLVDNNLILVSGEPNSYQYRYFVTDGAAYRLVLELIDNELLSLQLNGIYRTNDFFIYSDNRYIIRKRFGTSNARMVEVNRFEYRIDGVTNTFLNLYVGGSNVDNPNISIFQQDGTDLKWYYFRGSNSIPKLIVFDEIMDFGITAGIKTPIKRYGNTAYIYSRRRKSIYLFNLDDNSYVKYDSDFLNELIPRQSAVVNLSDYDLIQIGQSFTNNNKVVNTIWANERPITSIYKVVYNYSERNFPFHLADNFIFSLSLPNNNPIADLEIFKYIVDFRIRYDEKPIGKELPESINLKDKKIKKPKFIKQNRGTGDVDKILGLVDETFNVADFLNVYSTR